MLCLGLAQESRELSKRMSAHVVYPEEGGNTSHEPVGAGGPVPANETDPTTKGGGRKVITPVTSSSSAFVRKRTYSTPYPFESTMESPRLQYHAAFRPPEPARSALSAVRVPASIPPSRIPKPSSRVRSTSKSSHNDAPSARATTPPDSNNRSGGKPKPQMKLLDGPDRSENASGSKTYSEVPPGNPDAAPTFQAEFEHWYRGEGRAGGGRNGGRGEIRAGTQEMLAIALGGHATPECVSRESWVSLQRPHVDDSDYRDSHELWGPRPWAEDYVLDERMLTDMEADGEATDSELPGGTPTAPSVQLAEARTPGRAVRQSNPPFNSAQTQLVAPVTPSGIQLKSNADGRTASAPSASLRTSLARRTESRSTPRVRRKNSFPPISTPGASRPAYDLGSVPALADAVPYLELPPMLPPSGNWDEVVLPTVAKKMRMVQHESSASVTMLGSMSKLHADRDSTAPVPPAPGTFAYNQSKAYTRVQDHITSEMGAFPTEQLPKQQTNLIDDVTTIASPIPNLGVQLSKLPVHQIMPNRKGVPNGKSEMGATPSVRSREMTDDESRGCCRCIVM